MLARGDAAPGHEAQRGDAEEAARSLEDRAAAATVGRYQLGEVTLPYEGASVGVVALDPRGLSAEEAVRLADARMYDIKRARKAAAVDTTTATEGATNGDGPAAEAEKEPVAAATPAKRSRKAAAGDEEASSS